VVRNNQTDLDCGTGRPATDSVPSIMTQLEELHQASPIRYVVFYRIILGPVFCPGIAVDLLQCFPANCAYGGRNSLHVAVQFWLAPRALCDMKGSIVVVAFGLWFILAPRSVIWFYGNLLRGRMEKATPRGIQVAGAVLAVALHFGVYNFVGSITA
jgi:hypothetical protein